MFIHFLLNKAALKLIRHCPKKYLVKKIYELLKLWASSSIFYTKKNVKYFIVLIMKPTLAGFLYIKKKKTKTTKWITKNNHQQKYSQAKERKKKEDKETRKKNKLNLQIRLREDYSLKKIQYCIAQSKNLAFSKQKREKRSSLVLIISINDS